MAGPRITRLGDPANPYSQKRTPTAAPTPAQQAKNRAVSQRAATAPKPKPAAASPKPVMQKARDQYQKGFDKRNMPKV